jgi:DNA polymerase-3 subunit beta
VSFQFSPEGLTFVADAHKLVKYARTDVKASQVADFIMPKKPLTILKNIFLLQMLKLKLNTTIRTLHFLLTIIF